MDLGKIWDPNGGLLRLEWSLLLLPKVMGLLSTNINWNKKQGKENKLVNKIKPILTLD